MRYHNCFPSYNFFTSKITKDQCGGISKLTESTNFVRPFDTVKYTMESKTFEGFTVKYNSFQSTQSIAYLPFVSKL